MLPSYHLYFYIKALVTYMKLFLSSEKKMIKRSNALLNTHTHYFLLNFHINQSSYNIACIRRCIFSPQFRPFCIQNCIILSMVGLKFISNKSVCLSSSWLPAPAPHIAKAADWIIAAIQLQPRAMCLQNQNLFSQKIRRVSDALSALSVPGIYSKVYVPTSFLIVKTCLVLSSHFFFKKCIMKMCYPNQH